MLFTTSEKKKNVVEVFKSVDLWKVGEELEWNKSNAENQLKDSYKNRDIDDIVSFIEGEVPKTKASKKKKGQKLQKVKTEGEINLKLAEPREDSISQAVGPSETGTRPKVLGRKPKSKSDQPNRSKPTVKVEKSPQAASSVNLGYSAAPQSRVEDVNKVKVHNLNPEKEEIPRAGKKPAMWKQDLQMLDFITQNIAEKELDLECPGCADVAQPPFYVCRNSHLICNICAPLKVQCPTCS